MRLGVLKGMHRCYGSTSGSIRKVLTNMNRLRITSLTNLRQIICNSAVTETRMGSAMAQGLDDYTQIDSRNLFQWQQQRFMAVPKKKVPHLPISSELSFHSAFSEEEISQRFGLLLINKCEYVDQ